MALKNVVLLLTAVFGALGSPVLRTRAELPVKVIDGTSRNLEALDALQSEETRLLLSTRLGETGTRTLLADDVAAGDAFWHKILDSATGAWVGVTMRAHGYAPHAVFNASSVDGWSYDNGEASWPTPILRAGPENYLVLSGPSVRDPQDFSEVIERWGSSLFTSFRTRLEPTPAFVTVPDELQAVSQATALLLGDGTVFAHHELGWDDLPGGDGVDMFAGFWIPDNVPTEVVEGLRAHITLEYSNWLKLAYKKAIGA
ncbi:hypothetical protein GGR51DRAFT_531020 [Nemania sp. FL0031]|nr:hypothetical protein GGR51DRAFT_531020 [Nemania sp. FL0031]